MAHKINYRKSQSIFTYGNVKKKAINNNVNAMRGGVRL